MALLMTLRRASEATGRSLRTLNRWVASGKLTPRGERRTRAGQSAQLYDFSACGILAAKSESKRPAWKRFESACVVAGCDPAGVLCSVALASHKEIKTGLHDIDLTAAAVRLILDPKTSLAFLRMLSKQERLIRTFTGEVARLLEPSKNLRLEHSAGFYTPFRDAWRDYRNGGATYAVTLWYDMGEVRGMYCFVARPKYLDLLRCKDIPEWAKSSVVKFRAMKNAAIQKTIRKIYEFQQQGKANRAALAYVLNNVSSGPLADDVIANAAVDLRITRTEARRFLQAWKHRIETNSRIDAREVAGKTGLPWAVINRAFGVSRAARVQRPAAGAGDSVF